MIAGTATRCNSVAFLRAEIQLNEKIAQQANIRIE